MALTLLVNDETVRGERTHTARVKLEAAQCSVRQLLEQRIRQEAKRFNLERPVVFRALVRPADADETAQGFRMRRHRDVDADAQIRAALEACASGSLTVHIDGKAVLDIDAPVALNAESQVTFISLMPVVGG